MTSEMKIHIRDRYPTQWKTLHPKKKKMNEAITAFSNSTEASLLGRVMGSDEGADTTGMVQDQQRTATRHQAWHQPNENEDYDRVQNVSGARHRSMDAVSGRPSPPTRDCSAWSRLRNEVQFREKSK